MEFVKNQTGSIVVLSIIMFAGLLYIFVGNTAFDRPFFSVQKCQGQPSTAKDSAELGDELEIALSKASMANRYVIIAVMNEAYVEGDKTMLDLFMDGFWLGEDTQSLVNHLLLVAVDQTSFERCRFLRLHCYRLQIDDGTEPEGERLFMSKEYLNMMWRRTLFLQEVLKRGYSFIFTDTDIMWLRNPLPRLLSADDTLDFQISTDRFNGDEWSISNPINGGFYVVKSNNKTIELLDRWYGRRNSSAAHEQEALQRMMHEGVFGELGIRVRFLDTRYFSGFCQDSRDIKAVITVHANCCRTVKAKLTDLMAVLRVWKMFKRAAANDSLTYAWPEHLACINSWKS